MFFKQKTAYELKECDWSSDVCSSDLYLCFSLDAAKGLVPMLGTLLTLQPTTTGQLSLWLAVGCAAIIGHIFPVYLKFRGGKGVATCLGVVLGLWPYYTLCGLAAFTVWVVFVWIWHYISLASIAAAVCFPIALTTATAFMPNWHFNKLWPLFIVALAMPALLIYRHRENIKRLIDGTESKISKTPT